NVKIGGSHSGITVGPDGATAQALEDIAMMRVLPNMTVIVPADAIEAKKATIAAAYVPGPLFLRLGRSPAPIVTREEDPFEVGRARVLREGRDVSIVACGLMVAEALKAAAALAEEGVEAGVLNMHTIKPLDEETLVYAARRTGALVTAEEHQLHGGLGSAVAEVLTKYCPVPQEMVGVADTFGESGEAGELTEKYGLTWKQIKEKAWLAMKRKRTCVS
ncbi:MAG: transketolase C-terminal domain-containing protein, partial [Chloroflexota bacterium]